MVYRKLENRRNICEKCDSLACLNHMFISLGITIVVIAVALAISHIQMSHTMNELELEAGTVAQELTRLAQNVHQSAWGTWRLPASHEEEQRTADALPDRSTELRQRIHDSKMAIEELKSDLYRVMLADGTGRADFALESAGARVLSIGNTKLIPKAGGMICSLLHLVGIDPAFLGNNNPRNVIQASTQPGNCFAFNEFGEITIKLAKATAIEAVSIEHILPEMSPDGTILNAPKEFAVYGLTVEHSIEPTYFGKFKYDIHLGAPIQTFFVPAVLTKRKYSIVRFEFLSNHGHPSNTCVYRVRVHGRSDEL